MTHSTDDRDGATERIPEGVALDRQAPGSDPAAPQYEPPAVPQYEAPAVPQYEAPAVPQYDPSVAPQWQQTPVDQPAPQQWQRLDPQPTQQQPVQQQPVQQQPVQQQPDQQLVQHRVEQSPQQGRQGPQHYAATYAPPQAAPVPAAPPKPEDLLVPNRSPIVTEPASWGWRGKVNRATGGLVKPKAAPAELEARQAIHDIQRSFSRPMTVVVVQPKGGAGKTPTTICLAAAFGANRGGYVVGWDDNETRGTLAVRVTNPDDKHTTVWDLLGDLAAFERFDARVGDLSHYVRSQPDAHFDALVSDDNPGNMSQIGEEEYHRLHKVLQRFYRMIVVDTGNNVRSPNWQAAVNSADLVVVVSTYQRDAGYSGSWVLDHLAQTGREELARNAVTVLTAADPTTDKTVRGQLIEHFTGGPARSSRSRTTRISPTADRSGGTTSPRAPATPGRRRVRPSPTASPSTTSARWPSAAGSPGRHRTVDRWPPFLDVVRACCSSSI